MNKLKFILSLCLFLNMSCFANPKEETIVCIHGFLGAPWNMYFLKKNFEKHGWQVINWKYASRDQTISEHAQELITQIIKIQEDNPDKQICFVAHSLGCLILRAALNVPNCPKNVKTSKIVLIAPPNNGSVWGRTLDRFSLFKKFRKDFSGKELCSCENFDHLGKFPESANILVIAGNLGFNPWIGKENDGTVAIDETYLDTEHKHVTIRRGHKTIIFSKKTFSLALDFLRDGAIN
ncbi:MAG: hypothetical protein K940chlam1_00363 [Candidatus Anoxychlamydiales bacterium]|nr:hypothetical protein [Candidatus Anoxychlamydiales bacterium]NGX36054.1 hypothetical protein [Candidatus Anoxychlamydiales bacterium]